jgi:hypothetical protein
MILFISSFPDDKSSRDGMMQRIAAVDGHFTGLERVYLAIRFFGHLRRRKSVLKEGLTEQRVNFFLHFPRILRLGLKATAIYVHSVHNGFRALPLYLLRNVITDMHGLFPEEQAYYGKKWAAIVYGCIEMIALWKSREIIVVSQAMADHLHGKYGRIRAGIRTVPIFEDLPIGLGERRNSTPLAVIYSGGVQEWQNIDLMMGAISRSSLDMTTVILTPDRKYMERKAAEYGLMEKVTIRSVPKCDVYRHYLRTDLGFILRDESPVNRAACPTKLVEYLASGVIPIVLNPDIGDFKRLGYSYVTLEGLEKGVIPTGLELEEMRRNNYRVIDAMRGQAAETMGLMVADLVEKGTRGEAAS